MHSYPHPSFRLHKTAPASDPIPLSSSTGSLTGHKRTSKGSHACEGSQPRCWHLVTVKESQSNLVTL